MCVCVCVCACARARSTLKLVQNIWYQISHIIFNTAPIFVILEYIQYLSYCYFMIYWILIKVMLIYSTE
jgi:hypothetical protein